MFNRYKIFKSYLIKWSPFKRNTEIKITDVFYHERQKKFLQYSYHKSGIILINMKFIMYIIFQTNITQRQEVNGLMEQAVPGNSLVKI